MPWIEDDDEESADWETVEEDDPEWGAERGGALEGVRRWAIYALGLVVVAMILAFIWPLVRLVFAP
jgi:hypothetical protein